MSVSPSSDPSFDGQSDSRPPGPDGTVVPDQELVRMLLDQMELKYAVDEDGDLLGQWEHFRMYFMFRGDGEQELFSVRTFYDRLYPIEAKPPLLEVVDDWNRRTLWPKVYTHTGDDGSLRLIGEMQMVTGTGVSLGHFLTSTASWVGASVEFDNWVVQQFDGGSAE